MGALTQAGRVLLLHPEVVLQLDLLVGRLGAEQLVHQVRLVLPGQMSVHVKLQLVLASKALSASLAGEGSLSSVSPDVSVEVRHPGKLGLAVCTGVGTDTVVDLIGGENISTFCTAERDLSPSPAPLQLMPAG